MILTPSPISTALFSYRNHTFTAEMSTLEGNGFRGFGRVYDDACDEGLTLVSQRTGERVAFGMHGIERDDDGDVMTWVLKPADPRLLGTLTVIIYND